jgi:hypothetical protein
MIPNAGKPSLFGNNVTTFGLELPPDGATFFEQAMQGEGGAVSIVYDLQFWARMPEMRVDAYWDASKFYSFYQTIDIEWNFWSEDDYRETVREQMKQSESERVEIDPGGVDAKIVEEVRSWAYDSLEKAVERNMIKAIAPVPDDQRKAPDGIENVTRDISSHQISSVSVHYRESQTVPWRALPQGILPNITTMKDADGNPIKWSDYARVIDLDDPFFKTLRVNVFVNADFKNLPIHSVEVKLTYQGRPMPNLAEGEPDGEVVLGSEGAVGKFAAFIAGDDWKYKYSYQVNYRGESRQFQSPEIETNEGNLTIGVDDVGLLAVDVSAGDLNWSELERVGVVLTYEDSAHGVAPIEEQFQLTQAAPEHRIQRVIFQPLRNNYRYRVKYFMKGGKEFQGPEQQGRANKLFVNDVFDARKTISVRGVGDFANRIQTVFVDVDYTDTDNGYSQTKSQALNATTPFFDWTFPVISDKLGKVTYRATIAYKDGTSEQLPPATASTNTIVVPPPVEQFLDVALVTDLLAWDTLRLVRVGLSYADPDNHVAESKDIIFSPTNKTGVSWKVGLKNRAKDEYTYAITYFMSTGPQKKVGPTVTHDQTLILDATAA